MASINGVGGSSLTSSLYNSANIISGLASGLDTEGMIENLVKSYQNKIQSLTNKATKLEWKQEAYRGIISKMYGFSSKYTSYTSSTNLLSSSFFNSAIKIASLGTNKDAVSASGRTDSDIRLTSVKQLATSARYSTSGAFKGGSDDFSITAKKGVSFTDEYDYGSLTGSLVLNYGGQTVSLVFDATKDKIDDYVYKTDENGEYVLDDDGKRIVDRERTPEEKAADLKALIEKKLADTDISLTGGGTKVASDLIEVSLNGGEISFKDKSVGGNEVYISGASGRVESTLGLSNMEFADLLKPNGFTVTDSTRLTTTKEVGALISEASMNIALDGKIKSIALPKVETNPDGSYKTKPDEYVKQLQETLDKEFGAGKIKVTNESSDGSLKLKFKAPDNSDLVINTEVGEALGIENISTNYLNVNKTLGELMDGDAWDSISPLKGTGEISYQGNGQWTDEEGNLVNRDGNRIDKAGNELYAFSINGVTVGNYTKDTTMAALMNDINSSEAGVKVSYSQTTRKFTFTTKETGSENTIEMDEGLARTMFGATGAGSQVSNNFAKAYGLDLEDGEEVEISVQIPSGESVKGIKITNSTTIEEFAAQLNDTPAMFMWDYTAQYDPNTNQLLVTDITGKPVDVSIRAGDGEEPLTPVSGASANYTPGQDAVFSVEINGEEMIMTRGSNSVTLDGLTLTMKDTFNADYVYDTGNGFITVAANKPGGDKVVTFQQTTDADKIVDAVKAMVADYNEMLAEIRSQYATMPYQNSSGAFQTYEPLSDDDKATMSESAIAAYEAKAKQGILFSDRNLSSLYEKLRSIFTPGGAEEARLQEMGIGISYSSADNSASLTLDESKLRSMLENDPDAVTDAFTRTVSSTSTGGVMQQLQSTLDTYGRTTGAVKGILVEQAGSPLSPLTLMSNTWQKQIDSFGDQITKWQEKLSAQVDKYTSMFSRMETLISQMNNQSSTLAGLLGGTGG